MWIHVQHALSKVEGKPWGDPEPGYQLCFLLVFVSCVLCVRAGEAKLHGHVRQVLLNAEGSDGKESSGVE